MMHAAVVGKLSKSQKTSLATAASRAQSKLAFHASVEAATRALETQGPPQCIFVADDADVAALVDWVRDRAEFYSVPVVAMVPYAADSAYRNAYACGADDAVVARDVGGVTRRLANIRSQPSDSRPPACQGRALVAAESTRKRRQLGMALRMAGYDVSFAEGSYELVEASRNEDLELVVTTMSFPPMGGERAVRAARMMSDEELPAVVLPSAAEPSEGIDAATTDRLLFHIDEQRRGVAKDQRASRRVLSANLCTFRQGGSLEPAYGLTHNISREGLYVRTMDPPERGTEVWFELRSPSDGRVMHLRGRVVWRREAGNLGGSAPAGFGMQIDADSCPPRDLADYRAFYDALCDASVEQQGDLLN